MKQNKIGIVGGLIASSLLLGTAACKKPSGQSGGKDKQITTTPAASEDAATAAIDAGPLVLPPAPPLTPAPLGLPATPSPAHNRMTPEKVALGALLFAEVALSAKGNVACSSCHQADHAYSSPATVDDTSSGALNLRHTPTLLNMAYHQEYYWDGRSKPLEGHIVGHWEGQLGSDPDAAVTLLLDSPVYAAHFARAFDVPADANRAADALASYVRTLRSGAAPWDRYEAGEIGAVSADVVAGAKIFNERAGCATCHTPPLYTDLGYHGIGVPDRALAPDLGRGKNETEGAAFKTPGLRSLRLSAPYFHNGSASNLDEVLKVKEALGSPVLNADEQRQLLLFLDALTP